MEFRLHEAPLLEVENLSLDLFLGGRKVRVIEKLSFSLAPGQTLGLVGESGCGKSLTAQAIMGLVPPNFGVLSPETSIRFNGRELTALSEKEMRELRGDRIALILQDAMTTLNPVSTIGAQMIETLRAHRKISKAEAKERSIEALREVGITSPEHRFHEWPHQLSGGMKQRVNIAIALLCEPALIIADEPTTALDVTIQAQILELLRKARENHRASIILITHDMGVVSSVANRILVMYAGRLVESASNHLLFRSPRHPYTQGLLASIPRLDRRVEKLSVIPGQVALPGEWGEGCSFMPRCAVACAACRAEPPLRSSYKGELRCWRAAEQEEAVYAVDRAA